MPNQQLVRYTATVLRLRRW